MLHILTLHPCSIQVTPRDTRDDNVLLEYEHALALAAEKRLCILPVLIGQRSTEFASAVGNGIVPKFDFAEL